MKKLFLIFLALPFLISCDKEKEQEQDRGIVVNNKLMQQNLLIMYDKNKDGILSKEEALEVKEIIVTNSYEPIDGLENFPNIELIDVTLSYFSELDVSMCTKLKKLFCRQNKLKMLDLRANSGLEILECYDGKLEYIDVSGLKNLNSINCADNKIKFLDIKNTPNLRLMACYNNKLMHLYLDSSPQLKELLCDENLFKELDISKNNNLTNFYCNGLEVLYMKEGQTIQYFRVSGSTKIVYK